MVFQTSSPSRTSVELVKLSKETIDQIQQIPFFKYKISIPTPVLDKFQNIMQAYYHTEKLFKAKYTFGSLANIDGETCIVSPIQIKDDFLYAFGDNKGSEKIQYTLMQRFQLNLLKMDNWDVFGALFYQNTRRLLSDAGFIVKGTTAIDTNNNLLDWIKHYTKNDILRRLLPFISLFPAFNFRLRRFGNDYFIQISPRSVLDYGKDLFSLKAEKIFSNKELVKIIETVSLPIGRTAKLYAFLPKSAGDSIDEKPFNGDSFVQFASKAYPQVEFVHENADLILVLPYGSSSSPWYFSSELVKPTMRFSDLASWDRDYYVLLGSEMKAHSSKRQEFIESYLKRIKFDFLGVPLSTNELFYFDKSVELSEPQEFAQKFNLPVFMFPSPWFSFRDRHTGRVIDVNRESTNYVGGTVDLLNHDELACFDSPSDLKLRVIVSQPFYDETCKLVRVLRDGFGKYKGFERIFGTSLNYEVIPVSDILSKEPYTDISPNSQDCVLVVGPRFIPESAEKTKLIYTFPETQILNKGVPVQFIADEPTENKIYDKSLRVKSNDANALFGISINILGKIGAKIMVLSPKSTDYFLPNSVILGYNISRIFVPIDRDISQEKSPRELVRTSTPLAAPLVMLNQDGSEIITQAVYPLPNETALFKEDRAERIIDDLPSQYNNVIIHKDGPFYPEEILDLKKIQRKDRRIIPVSIVSDLSPRMFSSIVSWNKIPQTGTVFKLSDNDFIMANSLVTRKYFALAKGWPNTILVTIHDEALGKEKLSSIEKSRIIYQIWALTRAHVGSQVPTRKPISIHYSDSMATFLRKTGNPMPEYFNNFGNTRNRFGYISRIFL